MSCWVNESFWALVLLSSVLIPWLAFYNSFLYLLHSSNWVVKFWAVLACPCKVKTWIWNYWIWFYNSAFSASQLLLLVVIVTPNWDNCPSNSAILSLWVWLYYWHYWAWTSICCIVWAWLEKLATCLLQDWSCCCKALMVLLRLSIWLAHPEF